jgi:hypothetical protein
MLKHRGNKRSSASETHTDESLQEWNAYRNASLTSQTQPM